MEKFFFIETVILQRYFFLFLEQRSFVTGAAFFVQWRSFLGCETLRAASMNRVFTDALTHSRTDKLFCFRNHCPRLNFFNLMELIQNFMGQVGNLMGHVGNLMGQVGNPLGQTGNPMGEDGTFMGLILEVGDSDL